MNNKRVKQMMLEVGVLDTETLLNIYITNIVTSTLRKKDRIEYNSEGGWNYLLDILKM